jgi:hypothetical protein
MKILVFDTETSGLPPKFVRSLTMDNANVFPYIVQFSYMIYNTETNKIEKIQDSIIKIPSFIDISQDSVNIHGITKEMCNTKGIDIMSLLYKFEEDVNNCNLVIGHNIEFDLKMIYSELYRRVLESKETEQEYWKFYKKLASYSKKFDCSMKRGKKLCNLKTISMTGREYIKYPTLSELHENLFGYVPKNLHNSLNDCIVSLRCYYKLKYKEDICLLNGLLQHMIERLG